MYLRGLYSIKKVETSEYLVHIHTWPHLLDLLATVSVNQPNTKHIQKGVFIICGFFLPLHALETGKLSWIFPGTHFIFGELLWIFSELHQKCFEIQPHGSTEQSENPAAFKDRRHIPDTRLQGLLSLIKRTGWESTHEKNMNHPVLMNTIENITWPSGRQHYCAQVLNIGYWIFNNSLWKVCSRNCIFIAFNWSESLLVWTQS